MGTVFLRRSRPDELHGDSLVDPPHAQAGEPAEGHRGKRRAVVDPDDLR